MIKWTARSKKPMAVSHRLVAVRRRHLAADHPALLARRMARAVRAIDQFMPSKVGKRDVRYRPEADMRAASPKSAMMNSFF